MSSTQKCRMCWNCEGNVPMELENCPYCAVYLGPANAKGAAITPPYQMNPAEDEVPASPYAMEQTEAMSTKLIAPEITKNVTLPLTLLLAGSVFFMFGIVLFLFSHKGQLTLRWQADLWFVYFVGALPMLFFGWRSLQSLGEDNTSKN